MSTPAITGVSDALGDVTSRILAVEQRIAALGGSVSASLTGAAPGSSTGSASGTSRTFASTLAQAQSVLNGTSTGSASGTTGDAIVTDALKYLGTPYKWGGTDPDTGLDCSGFTQRVMSDMGITIPRTAAQQATVGTEVPSLDAAQPGDLLILDSGHHVGIYVGDGKMIAAPQTGDVVKIQKVFETPMTIRRVTGDASATTGTDATTAAYLRSALLGSGSGSSSTSSLLGALGGTSTSGSDALSSLLGLGSTSSAGSLYGSLGTGSSSFATSLASALAGTSSSTTSTTAASGTSGTSAYSSLFAAATAKYDLPQGLLAAVAQVESGGDASAVSPAGAQGLMQLMPGTARELGVDATKPAQAVDGAARLLSAHLDRFGSVPLALAAYNAGAGNVSKYGGVPPFAETQAYVRKVSALMTSAA